MHTLGCSETARAHRGRCPLVYTVRRRCEFYATNIQGFCALSMNMENPVQVPVTILNQDRFKSCVSIWTSVCDATHISALRAGPERRNAASYMAGSLTGGTWRGCL